MNREELSPSLGAPIGSDDLLPQVSPRTEALLRVAAIVAGGALLGFALAVVPI